MPMISKETPPIREDELSKDSNLKLIPDLTKNNNKIGGLK